MSEMCEVSAAELAQVEGGIWPVIGAVLVLGAFVIAANHLSGHQLFPWCPLD
jgi:lactobin A/cerein 7B family class IIb bacteriocin